MKSAISLTLVISLAGSAAPVAAQERLLAPTSAPIARAITLEAVRLALAPQDGSADGEWSRVRRLAPGAEITVTTPAMQAGKRLFLSADESGLMLLNLTDPSLPAAARRVLRDMASNHQGYFTDAGSWAWVDRDVRVARDGVFVVDQKVADLGQVVARVSRADVVEIKRTQKAVRQHPRSRGVLAAKGALIGFGIGLGIGMARYGCGNCTENYGPLVGLVFGGVGAGIGAGVGVAASAATHGTPDDPDEVYRAP